MKEQLISFDTAKLAKEKGFNIPVYGKYNIAKEEIMDICRVDSNNSRNNISAPTQSLLQKWLREKHKIYVTPTPNFAHGLGDCGICDSEILCYIHKEDEYIYCCEDFYTYEESLEKGLYKALNLINN